MAKAKKYKLQVRENANSKDWSDCGDARFDNKSDGDKAAEALKAIIGGDLFQCVECDAEEAEQTKTAR